LGQATREEGTTGSRFCSGDVNLQTSGQKSCRQLITDRVRHVQMKLGPSFNRKERKERREDKAGDFFRSEASASIWRLSELPF
jgi:hypothetical protein